MRRAARGSGRAEVARPGGRTPWADRRRASPRYRPQRGRPRRSPRAGARLRGRLALGGRLRLSRGLPRGLRKGCGLRGVLRRDLRRLRRRRLLATVRGAVRARAGEDAVEPLCGLLLVHVLRIHQLAREDLLRLDEHLLLAGREALLVVAQRQVPNDLGQLEDVAGLHLVAVVLEAAVPVLRHLRAATGQRFDDDLDHVFADHLAEPDLLGVLRGDVDRHVVVQDLDRQVLAFLTEHLALFLLYDRACPVVWVHHLVADFVQARPFPSLCDREAGGVLPPAEPTSLPKAAGNGLFLVKIPAKQGIPGAAERRVPGPRPCRTGTA